MFSFIAVFQIHDPNPKFANPRKVNLLVQTKSLGIVIFTSYYKQLSADIKMLNYKMKTSFVSPEMPKVIQIPNSATPEK